MIVTRSQARLEPQMFPGIEHAAERELAPEVPVASDVLEAVIGDARHGVVGLAAHYLVLMDV